MTLPTLYMREPIAVEGALEAVSAPPPWEPMIYCFCGHSEEIHSSVDGRCLECDRLHGPVQRVMHREVASVYERVFGQPHLRCESFRPLQAGWLPMRCAPENATWLRVQTATTCYLAHYAYGGGEDQPHFEGWFIGDQTKGPFRNVYGLVGWQHIPDSECPLCGGAGTTPIRPGLSVSCRECGKRHRALKGPDVR